jgi:hypothetical protein
MELTLSPTLDNALLFKTNGLFSQHHYTAKPLKMQAKSNLLLPFGKELEMFTDSSRLPTGKRVK